MGQILSGRCSKNNVVGCEAWPSLCSKENVSVLIEGVQGCLEVHRKNKGKEGQYYEHIDGVSYLIRQKVGSGEYSEVFEASRTNTSSKRAELYAIKVYRSRSLERQKAMREEVKILQKLGSGCKEVVRLHHHQGQLDPENGTLEVKLVLDFCNGGTLRRLLKSLPLLQEHKTRIIAFQLVQALHYLHTRRIMHCDVKPENILFVDSGSLAVKLSDFGNAKTSSDGLAPPRSTAFSSSDIYVAPEILKETSYGTPADMWALGITLYQCLTGRFPFRNGTTLTMEVIEEICSGSFIKTALSSDVFPEEMSFNALLFLEKLLRVDPNERMNVIEALNHKWLKSADLQDINSNQLVKNSSSICQPNKLLDTLPLRQVKMSTPQFTQQQFSQLSNDTASYKQNCVFPNKQVLPEGFSKPVSSDFNSYLPSDHSTTASDFSFELLKTISPSGYSSSKTLQTFNNSLQNINSWDSRMTITPCTNQDIAMTSRRLTRNRASTSTTSSYSRRSHNLSGRMKNIPPPSQCTFSPSELPYELSHYQQRNQCSETNTPHSINQNYHYPYRRPQSQTVTESRSVTAIGHNTFQNSLVQKCRVSTPQTMQLAQDKKNFESFTFNNQFSDTSSVVDNRNEIHKSAEVLLSNAAMMSHYGDSGNFKPHQL